jgi:mannan endo-1,4-beta-mannosidase
MTHTTLNRTILNRTIRRLAAGGLGLVAAAALAACGPVTSGASGSGPGPAGAAAVPTQGGSAGTLSAAALTNPDGKFFGIEADGSPDSLNPAIAVAASVGSHPNLLGQYVSWGKAFDKNAAANALGYGALPYLAWEPFGTTVASIAAGGSDSYLKSFAQAVHAFGGPVAISFGHEMNGNWYPWGTSQATAADFVAAWRHIHRLFAAAGAANVIWVWNPNIVNPMPNVELEPYWPGSAYVDWVGITGYFATTGPHTFDGVYGPTITEVKRFTSKPIIIAETAVETGPDEVDSIHNLIGGVEASQDVLGFVWFDYNKNGVDWTLGGRPAARAAVASGLAGMHLARLTRGQSQGG